MSEPSPLRAEPVDPALCPHCGALLARVWLHALEGGMRPGDWGVCRTCAGLLLMDANGQPAAPTEAEFGGLVRRYPSVAAELGRARAVVVRERLRDGPALQPPEGRA